MFDSIGWGEIVVLALAALFIFGPERLPSLAKDAASGLKKAREAVTGMRGQLHDTLGDDFDHLRDIDLRQYHPKTFIRSQLMGDDEPGPRTGSTAAGAGATAAGSGATAWAAGAQGAWVRDASTPPPFDVDAT